jgi:hypothetical protein
VIAGDSLITGLTVVLGGWRRSAILLPIRSIDSAEKGREPTRRLPLHLWYRLGVDVQGGLHAAVPEAFADALRVFPGPEADRRQGVAHSLDGNTRKTKILATSSTPSTQRCQKSTCGLMFSGEVATSAGTVSTYSCCVRSYPASPVARAALRVAWFGCERSGLQSDRRDD